MAITAADVKKLREETGAGPMECKNVLTETNGDFEKAVKILKEKGLAAAEKRADRATNNGRVSIKVKDNTAVLVELSSETDFVARNPEFIELGGQIADKVFEKGSDKLDAILADLNEMVKDLATKIRENMSLKRVEVVKAEANDYLASYIHGDGVIGVVVRLNADKPGIFNNEDAKNFAVSLAMHVAAFNPLAVSSSNVDPSSLTEQKEIFKKQMEADEKLKGKPEKVLDGILQGKVKKYLSEICFLDQAYIKNDKITVAQALAEEGKKAGTTFTIASYKSFRVGA
ncbi:MAG: translation elongation factor Ts [Termitinemataceae bacterium]|nr:MAG: translation elongation factor Ts [Termitinemataceae bacterium]